MPIFQTTKSAEEYFYGKKNHFWDLGLENLRGFLKKIESPQEKLKLIQIAGTNGKGSVSAFLTEILVNAGYKVGRYNSPVVFDVRENISINDRKMSDEEFKTIVEQMYTAMEISEKENRLPTIFEMETALAIQYFYKENCDLAILEAGLGGKNDATNVSEKNLLSIFTSIGIDHTEYLGETIEEIAKIKAGIIKRDSIVLTGFNDEIVNNVISNTAKEMNAQFIKADVNKLQILQNNLERRRINYKDINNIEIPLIGINQIENAVIAIEAANALEKYGYVIKEKDIKSGIGRTRWPGRFEIISEKPYFVIDGAHNENAARRLADNIRNYLTGKKIILIMAIFEDKDYNAVIDCMKEFMYDVICVKSDNKRSMEPQKLKAAIEKKIVRDMNIMTADTIENAVNKAMTMADENSAIVAFGSLSHLNEIKTAVCNNIEQ